MAEDVGLKPGYWTDGGVPPNVRLGVNTVVTSKNAFRRFFSKIDPGLVVGSHCTMDGAHFAVGPAARMLVGDYCYFTNAVLLCEEEIRIGDYVVIGWNATIADTDFHPVAPAMRVADALACSPLGKGRPRPKVLRKPVIIDDMVWIGPNAAIFKGVHVGAGAFIEAGAIVTQDVPPGARVAGNPARVVGEV